MNRLDDKSVLVLGEPITLEDFVSVARFGRKVEFSPEYIERVDRSRALVEKWVEEERVMYGVTTGFGALCTKAIDKEETAQLQENIILSHSVSVGEPLSIERVRGIMLMVLQNIGQGYSGVRMCVLERYRDFLNAGLTPYAPGDGSVGYMLAIELLSVYQVQQFVDPDVSRAPATAAVLSEIGKTVPVMEKDMLLHPYIEYLKDLIHSGELIRVAEQVTGALS